MPEFTYIPAAPGLRAPDGRTIVAWRVFDDSDTAEAVCAPEGPKRPGVVGTDYSGLEILRTDRGFKKPSFWRFRDGPHDFLFSLPPDTDVPNDERVRRIPRVVFDRLRKELPVVPTERLFDDSTSSGVAVLPEAAGDDDDGEDMI
jgi:hypothetical protein